jgi:hypothetical protein
MERISPGIWVALAALVGFASSAIFSAWLHWSRNMFVVGYATLTGLFLTAYVVIRQVGPTIQLRRHWRAGLVGGVLVGSILAYGVVSQPISPRAHTIELAGALVWLGVVYGTLDALLLTAVPVLSVYGSRPSDLLRRGTSRMRLGGLALLASMVVTGAYHLGFAEFRGPTLVQPLIGNGIVTAGYLLTGSPLAAVLAHVIMHGAAVFHGMEGAAQLPPHY